jgi:ribosomal protein S18 acetylase RimI-like enzyme
MPGSYCAFRWRDATLDDAALLSSLNVAIWRETYAGLLPDTLLATLDTHPEHSTESWVHRLRRRPPDRWTRIVLAPDPVGYVWYGREEGRLAGYRGEIQKINLLRRAQGGGLGRAALTAAFQELKEAGLAPVALWVFELNRPALDFYRHLGGRQLGARALVFTAEGREVWETAIGWPETPAARLAASP